MENPKVHIEKVGEKQFKITVTNEKGENFDVTLSGLDLDLENLVNKLQAKEENQQTDEKNKDSRSEINIYRCNSNCPQ